MSDDAPKARKRYVSPFRRVKCSDAGLKKIEIIQKRFDELYRLLHQEVGLDKSFELREAVKLMQHACMVYTRACALQHDEDLQ